MVRMRVEAVALLRSIEAVEPRKYLHRDVPLTRRCVLEHHGGCQCTASQTRRQHLEVSHQRTKVAMVGRGEGVDGRLLEIDAFFS